MYKLGRTHTLRELLPHLCAARRMQSTAHVTCPSVCCSAVRWLIFVHGGYSLSCMLCTLVDSFLFFYSSVLIDIVTESLVKTTQYTSDQLFLGRQSTVTSSLTFPMASGQCDWIDAASTPTAVTSCRIQWQVCLGERLGSWNWADYNEFDNERIESSYASDRRPVPIGWDGATWTVDVDMLLQINDERKTRRQIRRIVVVS
jgi:hypothetical protein